MTATRLSSRVWLVGGSDGPASTDAWDGNQYLVWDGERGALIDCGTGRGSKAWLDQVASVTGDLRTVDALLITHYHADHAGGAAAAERAGLRVLGSPATAKALRDGDEQTTSLVRARRAGVYPADYRMPPAPSAEEVPRELRFGRSVLRVIRAPGHCDGHLVFALEEPDGVALFTGDTLFPGGRVSIQAIPDCRLDAYADTMHRLSRQPVVALYPGHGGAELDPGSAAESVRSASSSFARLVPPPNLLN
ncbi:MBL fold metallo-hydrolase [Leucobacter tenebrionis]|uniref:MBL fold metallo-hydrolase n=1 Tax=Leucobacter tenebrionis TaxID=2873270 RepID=UPI001CA6A1DB|nr:MBL fold metallo-hydrolase [Leucobacter tenebrionis]QZY53098.1 MBL fold metallo-hydrolase [Leucobacter tenebrionis]